MAPNEEVGAVAMPRILESFGFMPTPREQMEGDLRALLAEHEG